MSAPPLRVCVHRHLLTVCCPGNGVSPWENNSASKHFANLERFSKKNFRIGRPRSGFVIGLSQKFAVRTKHALSRLQVGAPESNSGANLRFAPLLSKPSVKVWVSPSRYRTSRCSASHCSWSRRPGRSRRSWTLGSFAESQPSSNCCHCLNSKPSPCCHCG